MRLNFHQIRYALIVFFLLASSARALARLSSSQAGTIDQLSLSYASDHHVPGLSIAVVDHGELIMAKGYGVADVENSVPADADTVYRIASLSKPITAIAAMKLVEAGKLDLDVPIQTYCPAFPKKPWPITTRELLSHQSGIRDYRNDEESINTRHYTSINQALTQFASDPLQFEPGTMMQYTSYGYIVVGCVIEGASASTYENYMQRAIFRSVPMPVSRLDDVFKIIPNRAHGYALSPTEELQNAIFVDVSNKPPGSGINSSARDMGNFVAALYSGKLVSKPGMDRMLTPAKTSDGKATIYALGFFRGGPIGSHRGLEEAGHGGDQQGFSSVLYLLPERQFGVVVLSNLEGEKISLDFIDLSRKIYDIVTSQSGQAAASGARSFLKAELQPLAFFTGEWNCEGEFTASKKPIAAHIAIAPDLEGSWIAFRWDDREPNHFHALELWDFDKAASHFTNFIHDNFGGGRLFNSPGWEADTLTWTGDLLATPAALSQRFVIERKSGNEFVITWQTRKPQADWTTGDRLTCRKYKTKALSCCSEPR